jgi:hypothetical protein
MSIVLRRFIAQRTFPGLLAGLLLIASSIQISQATVPETLYNEVIFTRGLELGSGGRAIALGGAYIGLSDDLSGLYWNPAGLATIRRIEMSVGLSMVSNRDQVAANVGGWSNRISRTRLNELGVAYPVPTYRGSLVLALGYHQDHSFDSFGSFRTTTGDTVFSADELEEGRLGFWSLGMGIDVSPIVSTGIALRLWTGYDDYSYSEKNYYNNFNWTTYTQGINTDLSGFNLLGGVLIQPTPWLRIGATLESPLRLKSSENYSESTQADSGGLYGTDSFSAAYEYRVSRSFRIGLGTAVLIGPVGISADVNVNDWSQITYKDNPPLAYWSREEANKEITQTLQPTADLHAGVEVWLPFAPIKIQGGFAYIPSPFKNESVISNKTVYSAGLGALIDQSMQAQLGLAFTKWDRSIGGWGENLQTAHITVTLAYRF